MTGPTPLATPMSGSTNGKKMYISMQRAVLMKIDFWNAERASAAVAVLPSGSRSSLRMNRSADDAGTTGAIGLVAGVGGGCDLGGAHGRTGRYVASTAGTTSCGRVDGGDGAGARRVPRRSPKPQVTPMQSMPLRRAPSTS